ncbi:Divalent metal cation transporter MntH [Pseudoclavibacter triregionum]|nr:Divalent metal cation transporter MntH [Pseudoclavibacter triregionum]
MPHAADRDAERPAVAPAPVDQVTGATATAPRRRHPARAFLAALGPAFVAAVAYVDPGNFAANFSAGAAHGTLLLWVLVVVNLAACFVQYLSSKLGFVTGRSLSELVGERLGPKGRALYWTQATLVVIATDIAEVIGGAVGLQLLFGIPLVAGGVITGLASLALLWLHTRFGQRVFELVILGLLLVIPAGFIAGLAIVPPHPDELASGLVPRFDGVDTVLLAVAMLGATVMPHVIYLHSTMGRDRRRVEDARPHGVALRPDGRTPRFLRHTAIDVVLAMALAGSINISMLVLAATAMRDSHAASTLEGIHSTLAEGIGPWVGFLFAVGLVISGIASTAVGGAAGASVMDGLVARDLPIMWRRVIVILPAVVLLALVQDTTGLLILSQTLLAFGIPFAIIPLAHLSSSRAVCGELANPGWLRIVAWLIAIAIVAIDLALVAMGALGLG